MADGEAHLSFDSEHRLRAENLSWDIDVWYPLVQEHTFRTKFIPLTIEEAQTIRSFHDVSWRHLKPRLSYAEVQVLLRLENEIDKQIKSHFSRGAFVRLCGRSPKDGEPLERDVIIKRYKTKLEQLLSGGAKPTVHTKMIAIAGTSWLQVNSGAEVMSLLLTSERVYADMIDWLKFGEPEQICLRDWDPDLTMDMEFRVFVCDNKITAISQYDHYAHYPHLFSHRMIIHSGITKLWEKVHPKMKGICSYIMDIGCLPSRPHQENTSYKGEIIYGDFRFIVIEFSPFFACTGPALFSWENDRDLLEGKKPFEFRLKEAKDLHPQINELIECNWDDRWAQVVLPYYHFYGLATASGSEPVTPNDTCGDRRCVCFNNQSETEKGSETKGIGAISRYILICMFYFLVVGGSVGIVGVLIFIWMLSRQLSTQSNENINIQTIILQSSSMAIILALGVMRRCAFDWKSNCEQSSIEKKSTSVKSSPHLSCQEYITTYSVDGKEDREPASSPVNHHLLFVYGTLKRNFHWNKKYLHQRSTCKKGSSGGGAGKGTAVVGPTEEVHAKFLSEAVTCAQHRLVVGACGVPYLSLGCSGNSLGSCVKGELWVVSDECLRNLDDYEGVTKDYYQRTKIEVRPIDSSVFGQGGTKSSEVLKSIAKHTSSGKTVVIAEVYHLPDLPVGLDSGPFLPEYTLAMHQKLYNPIQHIQVKQLKYIREPSTWGKVTKNKTGTALANGDVELKEGGVPSSGSVTDVSACSGAQKGMQNTAH